MNLNMHVIATSATELSLSVTPHKLKAVCVVCVWCVCAVCVCGECVWGGGGGGVCVWGCC